MTPETNDLLDAIRYEISESGDKDVRSFINALTDPEAGYYLGYDRQGMEVTKDNLPAAIKAMKQGLVTLMAKANHQKIRKYKKSSK